VCHPMSRAATLKTMSMPMDRDYRPPYIQAADVLRAAIASGELSPGQKLPSARELQQRFDIASSTVQNALRLLKEEGLIYSVQGRGSYVSSPPGAGAEQILIQPTPGGGAVSVGRGGRSLVVR
jgi:DNA-binding GntR family transcriptional regulator